MDETGSEQTGKRRRKRPKKRHAKNTAVQANVEKTGENENISMPCVKPKRLKIDTNKNQSDNTKNSKTKRTTIVTDSLTANLGSSLEEKNTIMCFVKTWCADQPCT